MLVMLPLPRPCCLPRVEFEDTLWDDSWIFFLFPQMRFPNEEQFMFPNEEQFMYVPPCYGATKWSPKAGDHDGHIFSGEGLLLRSQMRFRVLALGCLIEGVRWC